ncbi:hypothetical protein [Actinokineospora cianjurensis]|uniref:Uncharacterized protein n=1 Tax=Actinokineospora cianjurensis TaxID=585224 RepID=A0A421B2E3_9PSEU|nr:hypothetical protein [Actinokineospora cianjurensis]RLK58466.1 hypothetical protein CLV68_4572 [Actinokineospora cianjurensis]
MAVIRPDLTVLNLLLENAGTGWARRGDLRASFRDLTTTLGSPDFGLGTTEESTLWLLDTPAGPAQLHNWLGGSYFLRSPDSVAAWQIQAPGDGVLPWIYKVVTGSTTGFPDSVRDLAFGAGREELTQAYLNYLRGRERAVSQLLHEGDLVGNRRIAAAKLWQQLLSTLLTLGTALGPHLPLHPGRFVEAPTSLSDALNQSAMEAPLPPWHDRARRDEHVATVRALASARVPDRRVTPAGSAAR